MKVFTQNVMLLNIRDDSLTTLNTSYKTFLFDTDFQSLLPEIFWFTPPCRCCCPCSAGAGGLMQQSWQAQLLELEHRLNTSTAEWKVGRRPSLRTLFGMLVVG